MLSDNGVYVAEFDDGFRVAYGQDVGDTCLCFDNSPLFETKEEAIQYASGLYDDLYPICGNGIRFLGKLSS